MVTNHLEHHTEMLVLHQQPMVMLLGVIQILIHIIMFLLISGHLLVQQLMLQMSVILQQGEDTFQVVHQQLMVMEQVVMLAQPQM